MLESIELEAEGRLDLDGLAKALKGAGVKAKAREKAFDFSYVEKDAVGEEWTLSMSAVLSIPSAMRA